MRNRLITVSRSFGWDWWARKKSRIFTYICIVVNLIGRCRRSATSSLWYCVRCWRWPAENLTLSRCTARNVHALDGWGENEKFNQNTRVQIDTRLITHARTQAHGNVLLICSQCANIVHAACGCHRVSNSDGGGGGVIKSVRNCIRRYDDKYDVCDGFYLFEPSHIFEMNGVFEAPFRRTTMLTKCINRLFAVAGLVRIRRGHKIVNQFILYNILRKNLKRLNWMYIYRLIFCKTQFLSYQ